MKCSINCLGCWVCIRKFVFNRRFHLLIFLFSFLILTIFKIDSDLGWHLAMGREFLETGKIVIFDHFSWTMPGYRWGNSYFLYQIFVTLIFNNLGHIFLGLLFGFLASVSVLILLPKKLDFSKVFIVFLGVGLASMLLGVRPHTISFLAFSILLVFLDRRFFEKWKHIFLWLLLFAIWVNFHRGFLAGLTVLSFYLILDFLESKKNFLIKAGCLFAAVLGTILSPAPFDLWKSAVFFDLTSRQNLTSIAEWQSTAIYFPINLLYAFSGLIFVYILFKNFKRIPPILFLTASFIFAFGFLAITFVFFWSAIFIFIGTRYFSFKVDFKSFWVKLPIITSSSAAFISIFLYFILQLLQSSNLKTQLFFDGYPYTAVEYLKKENLTKNLFNEYVWGGYIDWQFSEAKVFIDGRMASWNKSGRNILGDYIEISKGNCELAKNYDIKVALIKKDEKMPCFSNWRKIYEDSTAVIFKKN